MPDVFMQSVSVRAVSPNTSDGIAGGSIVAGNFLYRETDGTYKVADCLTALKANVVGIALNNAVAGQPIAFTRVGEIQLQPSAFFAYGDIIILSQTPGKAKYLSDVVSNVDYVTLLGYAMTDRSFMLTIHATGLQYVAMP